LNVLDKLVQMDMVLTRQEKEDLVLDLYNQGRTYREIAEEARMSPRDIGVIVNRAADKKEMEKGKEYQDMQNIDDKKQDEPKPSLPTQAYRLFSKGKTPIEVAVTLDLGESEVTRLYKEYLNLIQLHNFYLVYEETEGEIEPFLKLYELSKAKEMGTKEVINLLEIANNDLPALENRYNRLKKEADDIEYRNANSNRILQNVESQIITSSQIVNSYNITCEEARIKIDCLRNEKVGLRKMVRQFKRNNEEYLKIKKTVEQEVTRILLEGKELLNLAFYSLMESMRMDPDKYSSIIYYNPSTIGYGNPFYEPSYIHGQQNQQYLSLDSFFDAYKTTLLDESEKLYKNLVRERVNSIIANYISKSASVPSAATVNNQFEMMNEKKGS
jgi:hypothetical protein